MRRRCVGGHHSVQNFKSGGSTPCLEPADYPMCMREVPCMKPCSPTWVRAVSCVKPCMFACVMKGGREDGDSRSCLHAGVSIYVCLCACVWDWSVWSVQNLRAALREDQGVLPQCEIGSVQNLREDQTSVLRVGCQTCQTSVLQIWVFFLKKKFCLRKVFLFKEVNGRKTGKKKQFFLKGKGETVFF